jgi:hypothetical protein
MIIFCPFEAHGGIVVMGRFEGAKYVGLRDRNTKEVIAVYPKTVKGTDAQVEKSVMDWYYTTSCEAENILLNAYVDVIKKDELV